MAVIERSRLLLKLLFNSAAVLFFSGGCSEVFQKNSGVSLWKGTLSFESHYRELENPRGILPPDLHIGADNGSILRIGPVNFHEYFVYDEKTTLLVLSTSPFYYMKIESREFRFHLDSEYAQFAANPALEPEVKIINTTTNYKQVGDSRVAIYFSPTEIHFTSSGVNRHRITDANSNTSVDMWKLLDAAGYAAIYTPVFEEQRLFLDIHAQIQADKKRVIYTRESALTPKNYSVLNNSTLNFTFIAGKNLSLTPEVLGTESEFFVDRVELTRDFIFFFSSPPGNAAGLNNTDYLNKRHGLALQIRGQLDSYIDFLEDEGVNFEPDSISFLSILLTENSGSPASVTINWFESETVQIWYSTNGSDFTLDDQITGASVILGQTIARGSKVWIRLVSPSSGHLMAEDSIVIARLPEAGELVTTEIMWMGTYETGSNGTLYDRASDEFIEIKNTTEAYLNLKDLRISLQQTLPSTGTESDLLSAGTLPSYSLGPGKYFLLVRTDSYLFSRENLNPAAGTFYKKSFSLNNPTSGQEFTVRVYDYTTLIDSGAYTNALGLNDTTAKKRGSAIRLTDNSMGTSINDVNTGPYAGKTFCSPGYGAEGEK